MMTALAAMSETAVKWVGLAVTMPGNRARDRGGDVAVRGNSNLRLGTLDPFCSGSLQRRLSGRAADFRRSGDGVPEAGYAGFVS